MSDQRSISADGLLWYRRRGADFEVGFTQTLLDMVQSECWGVIPTHAYVRQGQPLLAVETNDTLLSIPAPFAGRATHVDFDAQNSPEKLTVDSVVVVVTPQATVATPAPRAQQGRQVRRYRGIEAVDHRPVGMIFDELGGVPGGPFDGPEEVPAAQRAAEF